MPQPSRKGKKEWRKNIDIADVEERQEELRKEEMQGGPVAEKTNEQLFMVDTQGNRQLLGRLKGRGKRLRIDEVLAERSAVPAVATHLRAARVPSLSKAESAVLKKIASKKLKMDKVVESDAPKNIWASEPVASKELANLSEKVVVDFLPETAIKKPVKMPITMKMKALATEGIPAVEPVHPGSSYNPRYLDHQDVLRLAVDDEMKKLEQTQKLQEHGPNKQLILQVQNLDAPLTMAVDVDEKSDAEEVTGDFKEAPVQAKKKEKRKKQQTTQKEIDRQKSAQQLEKLKDQQLISLKKLCSEIQQEKNAKAKAAEVRRSNRLNRLRSTTLRLSKFAYKPLSMAVQLTEDLPETLRQLKPEGNAFKERFDNLQRRCLIETRLPVSTRRRYQMKEYEKHSYKQFK